MISGFVDADHAGDKVTRRSHTGIILFCNRAPIVWYSKQQNTVETSTFGSQFIAARIAVELIESLRYKLRMFGVPIDGPANVYCDNDSVCNNATKPETTLKRNTTPSLTIVCVRLLLRGRFVLLGSLLIQTLPTC
jgi:hypothetical protein